jgi:hypothetical protein
MRIRTKLLIFGLIGVIVSACAMPDAQTGSSVTESSFSAASGIYDDAPLSLGEPTVTRRIISPLVSIEHIDHSVFADNGDLLAEIYYFI